MTDEERLAQLKAEDQKAQLKTLLKETLTELRDEEKAAAAAKETEDTPARTQKKPEGFLGSLFS